MNRALLLKVEERYIHALDLIASMKGVSRSELIRAAVGQFIMSFIREANSPFARIQDVVKHLIADEPQPDAEAAKIAAASKPKLESITRPKPLTER